jgi:hypothetical protein
MLSLMPVEVTVRTCGSGVVDVIVSPVAKEKPIQEPIPDLPSMILQPEDFALALCALALNAAKAQTVVASSPRGTDATRSGNVERLAVICDLKVRRQVESLRFRTSA